MEGRSKNNKRLFFSSEEARKWFDFILREWFPKSNTLVMVPCASKKPFYTSLTHTFISCLWKLWQRNSIDLIVVSEPLTVVPAEYDYPIPRYPVYDYPPKLIKKNNDFFANEREIWRRRFSEFVSKIDQLNVNVYYTLYPYHKKILGDELKKFKGYFITRPYLSKAAKSLVKMMEEDGAI